MKVKIFCTVCFNAFCVKLEKIRLFERKVDGRNMNSRIPLLGDYKAILKLFCLEIRSLIGKPQETHDTFSRLY